MKTFPIFFFYDAGINRDTKNQTAALTTEKL